MGHDVFISHSSKDKAAADAVCAALEANGVRCWIAPRDIKPSESWAKAILRGIAGCRMMVLVFSGHANGSEHIRREVERAVHRGIPIAPIRIADVMPQDELEYFLSSSHWMDALTPPLEKHLRDFTGKVRGLLQLDSDAPVKVPDLSAAVAGRQSPIPAAGPRRRSRLPKVAALMVVVAGLATAGWAFRGDLVRRFADTGSTHDSAEPKPLKQQEARLTALKDLFLADRITSDQYTLGQLLLKADPANEYDASRRAQFIALLDGKLAPGRLAAALSAIETPVGKANRIAPEQTAANDATTLMLEVLHEDQIRSLLTSARADQSPEKGGEGLKAIDQVLTLDPTNAEALSLRAKINSIMTTADAARAAEQRRQHVASLLQQAQGVSDKPEQAAPLVAELLKLDPENAEALRLKAKLDAADKARADAGERQRQIATLLASARADQSAEKGIEGLALTGQVLALDPSNVEAFVLAVTIADALALKSKLEAAGKGFTNTLEMKFVRIEAGSFLMGSPKDEEGHSDDEVQHRVKLTKPFYMATTTVTQKQWKAVMGTDPSHFKGDTLPVEHVSWDDAVAFCKKLSEREGKKYRLPTEAEWEYCCRAGTTLPFNTGPTISTEQANYDGNETYGAGVKGEYREKTTPVATFKPNPWGLYDMHGNVDQLCSDYFGPRAGGDAVDPDGPAQGDRFSSHVLRGGSWYDGPRGCRAAYRFRDWTIALDYFVGFRVCLDL